MSMGVNQNGTLFASGEVELPKRKASEGEMKDRRRAAMSAQTELFAVPVGEGVLSPVAGVDVATLIALARAAAKRANRYAGYIPAEDVAMRRNANEARDKAREYCRLLRAVGRGDLAKELERELKP